MAGAVSGRGHDRVAGLVEREEGSPTPSMFGKSSWGVSLSLSVPAGASDAGGKETGRCEAGRDKRAALRAALRSRAGRSPGNGGRARGAAACRGSAPGGPGCVVVSFIYLFLILV